jgi:hypothetical protein
MDDFTSFRMGKESQIPRVSEAVRGFLAQEAVSMISTRTFPERGWIAGIGINMGRPWI